MNPLLTPECEALVLIAALVVGILCSLAHGVAW